MDSISIPLVEADEVKSGRAGGKTKGEKYAKYGIAIHKAVPWIKENITNSKDGLVRVRTNDIKKEMGGEFLRKNDSSIYWGLKYVLFQEGIVVETGTHTSGEKLLLMRNASDDDELPPSLRKYLEPAEEEEVTESATE